MKQSWWNRATPHGGIVKHLMVKQWKREGGTVEQSWWNSRTSHGGTVEHMMVQEWNRDVGSVKHLMVE